MAIKKITSEEAKNIKGKTDWEKVDNLADDEIEKAAKSDPDSSLPTDEDLKKFKRVNRKDSEE